MADVEMPFSVSLTQKDELHVESLSPCFFFFFPTCFWEMYFSDPQLSFSSRSRTGWVGCSEGKMEREEGEGTSLQRPFKVFLHFRTFSPHLFSYRTSSQPLGLQDKSLPSLLGSVSGSEVSLSLSIFYILLFSPGAKP